MVVDQDLEDCELCGCPCSLCRDGGCENCDCCDQEEVCHIKVFGQM